MPFVSPEKNAEAIEQKKTLPEGTSVNGMVMLAPPHVPVVSMSARSLAESAVTVIKSIKSAIALKQ